MPLIIQMFQCMFIPTLELLIKYNYYQYAPMVFSQCFLFILLAQVRQVICLSKKCKTKKRENKSNVSTMCRQLSVSKFHSIANTSRERVNTLRIFFWFEPLFIKNFRSSFLSSYEWSKLVQGTSSQRVDIYRQSPVKSPDIKYIISKNPQTVPNLVVKLCCLYD